MCYVLIRADKQLRDNTDGKDYQISKTIDEEIEETPGVLSLISNLRKEVAIKVGRMDPIVAEIDTINFRESEVTKKLKSIKGVIFATILDDINDLVQEEAPY